MEMDICSLIKLYVFVDNRMNLEQFANENRTDVETIKNLEKFLERESVTVQDLAAKIVVQKEYNRRIFALYLKSLLER